MSDRLEGPEHVYLAIISAEETIYEGEVLWVQVPLEDGMLGVWPGHAPLLGTTAPGHATFDTGLEVQQVAVGRGVLRVDPPRCVLALHAGAGSAPVSEAPAGETEPGTDVEALATSLEEALEETFSEEELDDLQERERG